jgi:hypothetical protein
LAALVSAGSCSARQQRALIRAAQRAERMQASAAAAAAAGGRSRGGRG